MNETHLTIHGNLTADPERITGSKGEFTTFRVAVNEFYRDQGTGTFVDGRSSFFNVVAYRELGTNVHQCLRKGMPVVVQGSLRINQWQTSNGESRSTPEIEAFNAGPDLRFGIATYQRIPRQRATAESQAGWRGDGTTDAWANGAQPPAIDAPDFADARDADQEPAIGSSGPLIEQQAS